MNHPLIQKLENTLFNISLKVDSILEDKYGSLYALHPRRLKRGESANGLMDGLFRVSTSFTAGYGSKYGRGYLIIIEISTLEEVEIKIREEIVNFAIENFKKYLERDFGNNVEIVFDKGNWKIIGNFLN